MSATGLFKEFGPFFNGGNLEGSALIYHYVVGTTTTKTCWTDRAKSTTAAQPLVADANGIASAYFDGLYKIVVKSADGADVLATWDHVNLVELFANDKDTWTPTLTCTVPGDLAVSYTGNTGYYEHDGTRVTAWFNIVTSAFTWTTASGFVTVGPLPVQSSSSMNPWMHASLSWGGITKAGFTHIYPYVAGGSLAIGFKGSGSGQPVVTLDITDFPSGGTVQLQGCVTYIVNA